jgi:hypothetical protein
MKGGNSHPSINTRIMPGCSFFVHRTLTIGSQDADEFQMDTVV